MNNLAFEAMLFAREAHKDQVRKYTGSPYADHLAEVAGIVATVAKNIEGVFYEHLIAVAWLHDCMEDQGVTYSDLHDRFGLVVAHGVRCLSDMEEGNRATRKALSCERLGKADGWIQTIKCADLISNTASIVKHDPSFAKVYLGEKRELLIHMSRAYPPLWRLACNLSEPI